MLYGLFLFLFVSVAFNFVKKKREGKPMAPNDCMTESRNSSVIFKCSDDNNGVSQLTFSTPSFVVFFFFYFVLMKIKCKNLFLKKKNKQDCKGPNTSYPHQDYFNCAWKKSCFSEYVTYENPQANDSMCSQSTNTPISSWVYATTCVNDLSCSVKATCKDNTFSLDDLLKKKHQFDLFSPSFCPNKNIYLYKSICMLRCVLGNYSRLQKKPPYLNGTI
ncbi:hypothetical protein RFI_34466 [Reticulomyxa filosa]|uniref:Uncharacterized protein n=1 Tax=Reticulomyxa filosa TaxID=46433 RepID=X6LMY0_RETFI|nr:hypothetical protein RFI_34466 [Reticulomyxa filosa]|eukprot:ETO02944.1 hypothetical protein RFI_34466 [Reticulomyxa filosa]